jgi:hypothetical protein
MLDLLLVFVGIAFVAPAALLGLGYLARSMTRKREGKRE